MKIRFLGATQRVTGSNYLVEAAGKKFLVDCGLNHLMIFHLHIMLMRLILCY